MNSLILTDPLAEQTPLQPQLRHSVGMCLTHHLPSDPDCHEQCVALHLVQLALVHIARAVHGQVQPAQARITMAVLSLGRESHVTVTESKLRTVINSILCFTLMFRYVDPPYALRGQQQPSPPIRGLQPLQPRPVLGSMTCLGTAGRPREAAGHWAGLAEARKGLALPHCALDGVVGAGAGGRQCR